MQGEGERVGVRGTAPSQNRTYINGQSIASADWWISSQPNRGFNYTLLPAEIVSSLEVFKSPEADHDEGSLGGSIDIKTLSPLSTEDGKFIASAQLQYSDVSGKTDPQMSLFYNTLNSDKTFGALISLTRHERSLRRDGLESWGWAERNFWQDDNGHLTETEDENADLTNIWSAGGGGSAVFQQHRILSSAMATLQFQPNYHWNIELNGLYSRLEANNTNQNFLWQPSTVYGRGGVITDHQIIDNTLAFAKYSQVPTTGEDDIPFSTSMEAIWRSSAITTRLLHLTAEQDLGNWQNQYQIGITKADGGTSKDFTSQWSANTEFSVDLTQAQNIIADYQISPTDAEQWRITEVRWDKKDSIDQEFFAQADFQYHLQHDFINSVKFGVKYKNHQREYLRMRSLDGGYLGMAGELNWNLSNFSASMPSGYLQGIGNAQTLKNYAFADISKLDDAFGQLSFHHEEEKPSSFDIQEQTFAGYGKINFSGEGYRGNLGLRLVQTKQTASAFQEIVEKNSIYEDYLWSTTNKQYFDLLPSVNLAFDVAEDTVVRVAASKVMSRPEYHHLMPSTNYNVTQAQGAGGNPELEPFRSTNFDLGIEWYFDEASLLSLAAFHKDIASFIDINRSQETYEGVKMVINRPINGNGGSIYGVEVNFQQELFYGFGLITNYTYVQGERKNPETGESVDIPGNSDHTANLTAYFENQWLNSRLAYNYRTEFATGVGEEITDSYGQWDINIAVNVAENMALVFEAINLTDEVIYTYERNQFAPVGIYKNGRRLYAGIRVNY